MNHSHKYRVWDLDKKKFIDNTGNPNIFPWDGGIGMTCNGSQTGYVSTDGIQDEYLIIRCTGLIDNKTRILIFEQDIIRGKLCFESGFLDTMGVVEWSEEYAAYGIRNDGGFTLFHNHDLDSFEIIGNSLVDPEKWVFKK